MTAPAPVQIIRPKLTAGEALTLVVTDWISLAASAAVIMLLLGACHASIDGHVPALGYWQVVLGLVTARCIIHASTTWDVYKLWTKEAPRAKAAHR